MRYYIPKYHCHGGPSILVMTVNCNHFIFFVSICGVTCSSRAQGCMHFWTLWTLKIWFIDDWRSSSVPALPFHLKLVNLIYQFLWFPYLICKPKVSWSHFGHIAMAHSIIFLLSTLHLYELSRYKALWTINLSVLKTTFFVQFTRLS